MSVHEFRNPAWTNVSNGTSWTTVQGSSAWPASKNVAVQKPNPYIQQQLKPPINNIIPNQQPAFQWTSSWDPVISPASYQQQKKAPINTKKDKKYEVQIIAPPPPPVPADNQINLQEKQLIEDELSKQNLYKTELCRSFCETGVCRYGHKCQFAHGEHELRPVMRHPKYKTETCKTFSNTGTCPYGNRCRFIHPGVSWGTNWEDDMIHQLPDEIASVMEHLSLGNSLPDEELALRQMTAMGMGMPHHGAHLIQGMPMPLPIMMPMPMVVPQHQIQHNSLIGVAPLNNLPASVPPMTETTVPAKVAPLAKDPPAIPIGSKPSDATAATTTTTTASDKGTAEDDDESDSKPRLAFFQNLTVP